MDSTYLFEFEGSYALKDYADACDRLAQLNLTDVQQREIIRVLLHCCGNVRNFFL